MHDENEVMIWELNKRMAIRQGDWKLLEITKTPWDGRLASFTIFHVDPGETDDIRSENIEKAEELVAAWETYVVENGVIMPE